jgi:hypothetical protein
VWLLFTVPRKFCLETCFASPATSLPPRSTPSTLPQAIIWQTDTPNAFRVLHSIWLSTGIPMEDTFRLLETVESLIVVEVAGISEI